MRVLGASHAGGGEASGCASFEIAHLESSADVEAARSKQIP
jgi:hypothetical protein